MTDALVVIVVAALGSVGITAVFRALPPFSRWNENGVKPWSCDLCMSFWGTALCLLVGAARSRVEWETAFLLWMPSFAVAFITIQRIAPEPTGGAPIDPPVQ